MPRYKLTIEYDGTDLVGWQRQENGMSIQQQLEQAIKDISQEEVVTFAAGRTDAGVHALGQVVHFDIKKELTADQARDGLNHHLKKTNTRVVAAEIVDDEFHARFDAQKRQYLYRILNRRAPPAIRRNQVWHVAPDLDIEAMRKASDFLIGNHDFSSFRASLCQAKSPIKTIDNIDIFKKDDEIHITVEAKSFLHHMIRNFVGTLQLVGTGKWQPEDIKTALEAKDRAKAGPTAPAHGLYFLNVEY